MLDRYMSHKKIIDTYEPTAMKSIDIDIPDSVFMGISILAHEKNITFNQMVVYMIKDQLDQYEKEMT